MGRHFSLNQRSALVLARGYVRFTEDSTLRPTCALGLQMGKVRTKFLCKDNLGGQFGMGEMGLSRKTGQVGAGESTKKAGGFT